MVTDLLLTKTELPLREGLPKVPSAVYRLVCVYKGREEKQGCCLSGFHTESEASFSIISLSAESSWSQTPVLSQAEGNLVSPKALV